MAAVSAGLSNLTQFPHGGSGAGTGWGDSGEDTVGVPEEWTTRGQMEFEALMRMLDNHVCGILLSFVFLVSVMVGPP